MFLLDRLEIVPLLEQVARNPHLCGSPDDHDTAHVSTLCVSQLQLIIRADFDSEPGRFNTETLFKISEAAAFGLVRQKNLLT